MVWVNIPIAASWGYGGYGSATYPYIITLKSHYNSVGGLGQPDIFPNIYLNH